MKNFYLIFIAVFPFLLFKITDSLHKKYNEQPPSSSDDLCPAFLNEGWNLPDEPVQLVKPDLTHKKLVIVEDNVKLLHKILGPVATIAVVGKFHSGKSFLMNQLMGKSKGFGIGFSVRPQTMGIWMWGRPIDMVLSNGKKVSVIFLDTEGFAANNISENYDAKIFAVSTLLSSHLVYNSVKIIDQADIDYLELLARRTQLFALRSQMSKAKWTEFNHDLLTFPPLLWVVQDFVQVTEDGQTTQEWLHQLMETHTRENEEYEISLLGIFKTVDCHTLFLPATDKRLLSDLSLADEKDLTAEYKQERDELIQKIQMELVPKEKNHESITGPELAALLEILVMAANDGSLAEVPSRWDVFIRRLEDTAVEDCYKFYATEMEVLQMEFQGGPVEPHKLDTWHHQSLKQSMRLLNQLLFGLTESVEQATRMLQSNINIEYNRFKDLNEKKIRLKCSEVQHQIELFIEDKFSQISMPVTTKDILNITSRLMNDSVQRFVNEIEQLVPPDILNAHIGMLNSSVQSAVDSVILKNMQSLESHIQKSMTQAVEMFLAKTRHSNQSPRQPHMLDLLTAQAADEAANFFKFSSMIAKEESIYPAYQALFQAKINDATVELHLENEQLAATEGQKNIKEMLSRFDDATSSTKIILPMNTSELDIRLDREFKRIIISFKEVMDSYLQYPSIKVLTTKLKDEMKKICEQRRKENVEAFAREVSIPLNTAKKIIILSADKYTTSFSLQHYMNEVCLLNLNEGKANSWPIPFKMRIIEHFIFSDKELYSLLMSRESLWSRILGFCQWLAWLLNLY